MSPNNEGVHATHCCTRHGCKYGDEDCPVVTKKVKQEYPCWECNDDPEVREKEYLYVECVRCEDRMKLSKNNGGGCWQDLCGLSLAEFLQEHSGCGIQDIKLVWED